MALPFGTPYHGAVAATVLTSLSNGQTFVACSVHVRPNDAFHLRRQGAGGQGGPTSPP